MNQRSSLPRIQKSAKILRIYLWNSPFLIKAILMSENNARPVQLSSRELSSKDITVECVEHLFARNARSSADFQSVMPNHTSFASIATLLSLIVISSSFTTRLSQLAKISLTKSVLLFTRQIRQFRT